MKIADSRITISGKAVKLDVFKKLNPGETVRANILKRLTSNRALIEIRGRQLNAEFTRGIPQGNAFMLILQKKTSDTLYFHIERNSLKNAMDHLLDVCMVIGRKKLPPGLPVMKNLVTQGFSSIYHYNVLLLNLMGYSPKKISGMAELLNSLSALGLKIENLEFFSYLFYTAKGINLDYIYTLLNTLGQKQRNKRNEKKEFIKRNPIILIENLISDIKEAYSRKNENIDKIIEKMIQQLLTPNVTGDELFLTGTVPYMDDNVFREARFIKCDKALLLNFELSALGELTIIAKEHESHIDASLFCNDREVEKVLQKNLEHFRKKLNKMLNKVIKINVYVHKFIVDKISEFSSLLEGEGEFNRWA